MFSSSLSVALDAIVDTPDDEFQHHPEKVREVFQKLQTLLCSRDANSHRQSDPSEPEDGSRARLDKQPPLSPATLFPLSPPQLPSAAQNLLRQDHSSDWTLSKPQHYDPHLQQLRIGLPPHAALVDKLQEKYREIEDFLRSQASELIAKEPKFKEEDPRVLDILSCERHTVTMEQQLLRALGQRSLAKDYDHWTRQTYGRSKIDELVETLDAPENASGHVTEFVRKILAVNDEPVAARGIAHGIRLLVIEQLAGFCGTSALLSFAFRDLRYLKYAHFPDLVSLLHGTKLHELSEEFSSLFVIWQDIYDEKRKYEENYQKRRRLNDEEKEDLANRVVEWSARIATTSNIASESRPLKRKTSKNPTAAQSRYLHSNMRNASQRRRESQQNTIMSAHSQQRFRERCDSLPNRGEDSASTTFVERREASQGQGSTLGRTVTTEPCINPARMRISPHLSSTEHHQFETQFETGQSGLEALVQAANSQFQNSDAQLPDLHVSAELCDPNLRKPEVNTHSREVIERLDPHQRETPNLTTPRHPIQHEVLERGPNWSQLDHTYEVGAHNSQLSPDLPTFQLEQRPCSIQGTNFGHASNDRESAFPNAMLQNGNTTSDSRQEANIVDWFVSEVAEVFFEDMI